MNRKNVNIFLYWEYVKNVYFCLISAENEPRTEPEDDEEISTGRKMVVYDDDDLFSWFFAFIRWFKKMYCTEFQ